MTILHCIGCGLEWSPQRPNDIEELWEHCRSCPEIRKRHGRVWRWRRRLARWVEPS